MPIPTKRDRVFDLIISDDPLFTEIDLSLRAYGFESLADVLVKLIRDIGTEQFNDSFVNDIKDFGDPAVSDVVSYSAPAVSEPMTPELLGQYAPVSWERFSVLPEVAGVLSGHDPSLGVRLQALIGEYRRILSGPSIEILPSPSVLQP